MKRLALAALALASMGAVVGIPGIGVGPNMRAFSSPGTVDTSIFRFLSGGAGEDTYSIVGGTETFTRGSTAFYKDGSGLSEAGSNGARTEPAGFLSEEQRTNLFLNSMDMSSTWTQLDAGDTVTDNAATAPDGTLDATTLVADTTDGAHGVSQAVTLTAATYVVTCHANDGDQTHLFIENTTASASAYFDLTTCSVGTVSGTTRNFAEDVGDGTCRAGFSFTGTAAAHTFNVRSAEANADAVFAGDGSTVNTELWGCQVELGRNPSSVIRTTGSTGTRLQDDMAVTVSLDLSAAFTLDCTVTLPDLNMSDTPVMLEFNDGGADRFLLWSTSGGAAAALSLGLTNGTVINGTTDIFDGAEHDLRLNCDGSQCQLWTDGNLEGTDASADTIPGVVDSVLVGRGLAANFQTDGNVSVCRIYDEDLGAP